MEIAINRKERTRALGSGKILFQAQRYLESKATRRIKTSLNRSVRGNGIYRNTADRLKCESYKGMKFIKKISLNQFFFDESSSFYKFISQIIKMLERVIECRLMDSAEDQFNRFNLMPGRSAIRIFALRQVTEKCIEVQRVIYAVFIDLEKVYDGVLRKRFRISPPEPSQ